MKTALLQSWSFINNQLGTEHVSGNMALENAWAWQFLEISDLTCVPPELFKVTYPGSSLAVPVWAKGIRDFCIASRGCNALESRGEGGESEKKQLKYD